MSQKKQAGRAVQLVFEIEEQDSCNRAIGLDKKNVLGWPQVLVAVITGNNGANR